VGETEAILFIHGFYHNLDDSLKRFGQFLALGHFPPYMKPFVFNWPASTSPFMFYCATSAASDNGTHRDLKKFIGMMHKAGIKTLHVMCHSMGSRLWLRAWPMLRSLFRHRVVTHDSDLSDYGSYGSYANYHNYPAGGLNPEFGGPGGGRHGSTYFGSTSNLGHMSTQHFVLDPKLIQLQSLTFLNPEYELETFLSDYTDLRMFTPHISIYVDTRDTAVTFASDINRKANMGIAAVNKEELAKIHNINLDELDVINTVDLDRNMNEDFHGYFNINRAMVDDLYELIVTRKRAEERTSRLKLYAGIYRFTIVPSSVVQI